MAGRWRDPSAFRADPAAVPAARPSYRQTVALLAALVLVAGAVAIVSYVVRPERARAFQLFHGSLFLADEQSPVAIDLPSGRPTLRLVGAGKQVGVTGTEGLSVVPLDGGTLLLNQTTGEFNMVDNSGFLVKNDGGVPLGQAADSESAIGVAAGELAYIIRNRTSGADVFLVSQATVTSALSATGGVTPRAGTVLTDGSVDTRTPGAAVAADGALWTLVGSGGTSRSVREFTYPADSNPGVRLASHSHGTVSGPAAIGTATTDDGTAVGVATPGRIQIFGPTRKTVDFVAPAAVDSILPATSAEDHLAYLMHGNQGWSLASVGADGSGLRAPQIVNALPPTASLVQPAYSRGALYTLDRATGAVYRISLAGEVQQVADYPFVKGVETPDLSDAYVIASGARVAVNSGKHSRALVLFTDGSRSPRVIEKSSAVQVSAAGGAEQLARTTINQNQQPDQKPTKTPTKPRAKPAEVVNPHLDCKDVTQTPHVPKIGAVQPGSRSVALNWTYPIIDKTQDCFPTTYLVEIKLLSPNAPKAPGAAQIQGQQGATITGLFPQSRYEVRVTAYINKQGTASTWIPFTTGPEGPAAPTNLTVAADSAGNWILNWRSCGGVQQGCVPAQSWTVTPSFCDGRGLSSPPAEATAPADPTSRRQPMYRYTGGDALLGRGLQFVVTGSGSSQIPGTPSAKTRCVYSWAPPNAGAMTLTASKPDNAEFGETTSTTVRLDLGDNPTTAVGGVGAKIRFGLTGPGGSRSRTVTYDGSGTSVTVNFPGLQAGANYQASAIVNAPRHPDASVRIGPETVRPAADWPHLGVTAVCPTDGLLNLTCDFTAQISGITSAAANGETFDVIDTNDAASQIVCGSASKSLDADNVDPADPIPVKNLSTLAFHGTCTVTLVLKENGPIFGGVLKTVSTQFNIGAASTYDAQSSDWDQRWVDQGGASQAELTYQGTKYTTAQLGQITQNWTVTVRDPDGNGCGSWSGNNPPDGKDVAATGKCVQQFGDQSGWSVKITYQDLDGTSHTVPGNHFLPGQPPTYQPPCTPAPFAASWGGTTVDGPTIELTVGGQLAGCDNWSYEIRDPSDASCPGTYIGTPDDVTFTLHCATPPSLLDWKVEVSWTDTDGKVQPQEVIVGGVPPQ